MAQIDRVLRSNVKLRHLQLLVALDQFRHLGRTAEFLSVSQPAVSKMLSEVENMFGLTLFERSTRGSEPTAGGQSIIRFARSVLADYERTRDEIAAVESGVAGRTRVGAMVVALPVLLARAVELLKKRSPQATVLVEEGDLTHLLPKLRLGELDLFVGRLEPGYAAPDLIAEPLFNEPMVAVVKPGHALTRKTRPGWAGPGRHSQRHAAALGVAAGQARTAVLQARPATADRHGGDRVLSRAADLRRPAQCRRASWRARSPGTSSARVWSRCCRWRSTSNCRRSG